MGEVYKARDTRLHRDVAIKVLPERVAKDPEALARFEREARTVSQLAHPHIGAVYDVGREGETEYLVMELLEGEMLSERLSRGPLPLEDVLRFGRQIAQALDAAHRRGVAHRDLKPGNIMLTKSGVKLLDFGLARALAPSSDALTHAATAAPNLTQDGFILGTVGYMSPEQAEGREIDARSDIFALGAVLYEMVTGRRAFEGGSRAATLSAVLTSQPPPIRSVRPEMPPAIEPLVSLCLAKDRDRRWQSAHDVDLQLEAIAGSASHPELSAVSARHRKTRRLPWIGAGLLAALAAAALLWKGRSAPPPPARSIQFPLLPPAGRAFFTTYETKTIAVSPDGSRIAFVSSSYATSAARRGIGAPDAPGSRGIWIRDLGSLESRPVPGTEDASSLFWSPDGKSIGFFTPGKLKRIQLADGAAAVPICDMPLGGGTSGTWGSGGDILFASMARSQILRVSASGGVPEKLIEGPVDGGRIAWPWFLPDGKRFLYSVRKPEGEGGLMLAEPGKEPRQIGASRSSAQYVEPGWVLFVRDGALLAQQLDPVAGRLHGEPISVAAHVSYFFLSTGHASFAASPSGTLVYQTHDDVSRLTWFDREGRALERIGPPGDYLSVSLAPSGGRVLFDRTRPGIGTLDIWSWDLSRGVETAVTTEPETEIAALELPDGKSIIYSARRRAAPGLHRRDLAGGPEEQLTDAVVFQKSEDLSPDGRTLAYIQRAPTGNFDIWTLPLSPPGKPAPFQPSQFDKREVRFSPDGRYLAFISNESGQAEAYVTPFPGPGERIRISPEGARLLQWGRDGAVYFTSAAGKLVSLPVRTSPTLEIGTPTALFTVSSKPWLDFAVTNDGKRFLAVAPDATADDQPMTVVVDWPASLRRSDELPAGRVLRAGRRRVLCEKLRDGAFDVAPERVGIRAEERRFEPAPDELVLGVADVDPERAPLAVLRARLVQAAPPDVPADAVLGRGSFRPRRIGDVDVGRGAGGRGLDAFLLEGLVDGPPNVLVDESPVDDRPAAGHLEVRIVVPRVRFRRREAKVRIEGVVVHRGSGAADQEARGERQGNEDLSHGAPYCRRRRSRRRREV